MASATMTTVEELTQTIRACPACGTKNRLRPTRSGTPACGKCGQKLPWLVAASEASFESEVDASVPVLVDLWAPWCGPCRMVAPVLERLANEHAGKLKVVKLNVDEAPRLAQRYQAMSIPTLLVMQGGGEVDRVVGALPYEALVSRLGRWLDASG